MPKDKDKHDDDVPVEMTNPATAAHRQAATDAAPKDAPKAEQPAPKPDDAEAMAHDEAEQPAPQAEAAPAVPRRTIEELLADPAFDPEGRVRLKLATYSLEHGLGQFPPADLVDEHGTAVDQTGRAAQPGPVSQPGSFDDVIRREPAPGEGT